MARLQHFGFDWGSTFSGNLQFVGGRRLRGWAHAYRDNVAININPQIQTDTPGTSWTESYDRFYIRRATAVSVQKRVYGLLGSIEGCDEAVVVELGTSGQLKFYNWGNWVCLGGGHETPTTGQLLGSSSPLTIGQWYRIELHWRFYVGGGPLLEIRIDGNSVSLTGFVVGQYGVEQYGLAHHTSTGSRRTFGGGPASTGTWDIDDVAYDTSTWVGDTEVIHVPVTGIGHYNSGWTTAGGPVNYHNFTAIPYNLQLTGSPYSMDSTTAGGQISFALTPFADLGIDPDTGVIHGISAATMAASNGGANATFFIRKNGTDYYAPTSVNINSGQTVQRYYWNAATLGGLLITDIVEFGLLHDGTTTNCPVGGIFVDVEASNVADVEEYTGVVQIAHGTYSGTGNTQDITVGFRPDFLLVYGNGGITSTGPRFWWRGVYGAGTISAIQSVTWQGLSAVGMTGFTVTGNNLGFNGVSNSYSYLAISDPNGRVFDRDGFYKMDAVTWNQKLVDPTFVPEFLMVAPIYVPSSPTAVMARFNSQTGANSSFLNTAAADVTDAILSVGTGTFQLGNRLDKHPRTHVWAAFRTNNFLQRRLIYVGSYIGDDATNRVIPVVLANPLKFALVVPTNTERRVFKDDTMAAEESHYFSTDQIFLTAAGGSLITALTPTSITVKGGASANLNTSGVLYNILAFAAGTDDPAIENATLIMSATSPLTPMKVFGASVNPDTNAVMFMSRVPDGVEGSIYEGVVGASSVPVATPWTYDVLGNLPDGLTLDANTGSITGIATRRGLYTFSIRASHRD
jgi:hypothetical protein